MTELDDGDLGAGDVAPIWAVFGDLMTGLLGAFVLVLLAVLVTQMDLVASLQSEIEKRRIEEQRRIALEKALAIPLNSDQLRPEGRALLQSLVHPLRVYLGERNEMLMVSGFTDDKPVTERNRRFTDNLELSAQRALTVTRALIDEGMPAPQVFAAAFGAEQPVASNANESGRALNRRVEMAPVPRTAGAVKVP